MTATPPTEDRPRRIVAFPQEAVDTIQCAVTGEEIPAVLMARWSKTLGYVRCPVCSRGKKAAQAVWHAVELLAE